ncbi:MAG: Gfo/Idh/MocA family oxidoreductase [Candidatus Nanopelagicales bacterium]|nr:Gfo/Idh/MocA family oxidoreductase [Candidatus Nanopelagicales bacterium]
MTQQKSEKIGIAMIGHAFMGKAHSQAWRTVGRVFDTPLEPVMQIVVGRDAQTTADSAKKHGWAESGTDWREAVTRDDISIVDICTPGSSHSEIALAALAAGKHVLCEKPLSNTIEEALGMAQAAKKAAAQGIKSMVGFNYRRVPAITFARTLVENGRLGEIYHVRARYLQDWIVDPEFPLVWRLQKEIAGSGALGDIGSHIVDLTQYVTGARIEAVSGILKTFITERPLPSSSSELTAESEGTSSGIGVVTVDDAAVFNATFDNGALGTFEATRFASGSKNDLGFEVFGSKGSIKFNFEDMNVLYFHDHQLPPSEAGFRRIMVTEGDSHPYMSAWWPPGHIIGYEHTFTHEILDFLTDIANDHSPTPSFEDGLQIQLVLDAVIRSSANNSQLTQVERKI